MSNGSALPRYSGCLILDDQSESSVHSLLAKPSSRITIAIMLINHREAMEWRADARLLLDCHQQHCTILAVHVEKPDYHRHRDAGIGQFEAAGFATRVRSTQYEDSV